MSAFDLNLLSLYRINGNEWPLMPGLLALNPPRKTAHGREQDRLIVYLTLAGSVSYSPAEYGEMTAQIADAFYGASGSITLGLKTAVEWLNTHLIENNKQGQYSVAALVLAVLRGNALYFAQSGPTHVYWLSNGTTHHFNDVALAGRGLGLSETVQVYFAQANLNANDRVLFCAALPPNWDKSLSEERGSSSLETTRRRLLAITDTNVSAVLFQAVEGSGAMNILGQSSVGSGQVSVGSSQLSVSSGQLSVSSGQSSVNSGQLSVGSGQEVEAGDRQTVAEPASPKQMPASVAKGKRPKLRLPISPAQREKLQHRVKMTARFLAGWIQSGRRLTQRISSAIERLTPRLLPGEREQTAGLPASWLAFVALAIPLLVGTIGILVYYQIGQPTIFDSYYQRAIIASEQAKNEQEPTRLRTDLETVLALLEDADQYPVPGKEVEARNLRQQAQKELDQLNRVVRVNYRPAFNTALRRVNVTRMAASDIDVYLLDDLTGSVIHGILNGQSYTTDPGFDSCKPGRYNNIEVGMLTDIIALPRSNPSGASLIGIDPSGNLLYCASNEAPTAASLQRPDVGWQEITAVAYDSNNLYLLDAPGRAVWVFFGTTDIRFPDKPFFFFESQVPDRMEQAVGITVNGDDLYLLHQNGHLTTCTLSRIQASPTSCTDPATLIDTRPGYESGNTLTDAVFSQIAFASPPDPAVVLLEPFTQSIYRFSARALELQSLILPLSGDENLLPDGDVTAMAFSPNKVLFAFVGGQLYFAVNIP